MNIELYNLTLTTERKIKPSPEEILEMVDDWKKNNQPITYEAPITKKSKKIFLPEKVFTLIDYEDYKRVIEVGEWILSPQGYVVALIPREDIKSKHKKRMLPLHRFIMNAPKGYHVDHIDGDKLNNRKENLRICTCAENARNRPIQPNNTSGYKGVQLIKSTGKFLAIISINRNQIRLGYYETAIDAAMAYNKAAIKYHGEFAKLNEIPSK